MLINRTTARGTSVDQIPRRRKRVVSGLVVRVMIAAILSWLIIMAFFVTGVVSH